MTGLIINLRGTCGSGKTELARRILSVYGWARDHAESSTKAEPVFRSRGSSPFAYRLQHPAGGRPLVVVGQYRRRSGGCDTIRVEDGGLPEVMRATADFAASGQDVLMEGLRLSSEVPFLARLAATQRVHILLLNTPLEQCAKNLIARRRAGRSTLPAVERTTREEHRRVQHACERLRRHATVEVLGIDGALARARQLLQVGCVRGAA